MSSLRVAVIGTGFIGPVHVEALKRAGLEVVGILGSSEETSRRSARALGLARAYRSFDELLNDGETQSVHVAVPNRLHFDMVADLLRAGKHVMCEKPLAMNAAESAQLVRLARESNLAAGVNHNIRYYPLCQEAAARVRDGELGELFHVAGSYVQDWLLHPTDFNWRVLSREGGDLRAVADIGTHWLDLVTFITGLHIEAVLADLRTVHTVRQRPTGSTETFQAGGGRSAPTEPVNIDTEDYGCVMLRFAGGARGCLWVSQVTAGRKNCLRLEIAGSKQALAWDSECPNQLWLGHRDHANQCLTRDPALLSASARRYTDYPGGHNEGFPDSFKQCFRAFYDYIHAGDFTAAATFPTFADGHRELILCEAILQSHNQQRWVSVEEEQA